MDWQRNQTYNQLEQQNMWHMAPHASQDSVKTLYASEKINGLCSNWVLIHIWSFLDDSIPVFWASWEHWMELLRLYRPTTTQSSKTWHDFEIWTRFDPDTGLNRRDIVWMGWRPNPWAMSWADSQAKMHHPAAPNTHRWVHPPFKIVPNQHVISFCL